jgi:hypothetical protein
MTSQELLAQLKDIQPPPEPPWWLITPVQLLALALIPVLLLGCWWLLQRHRANRLAQLANLEFKRIKLDYERSQNPAWLAAGLSRWLRQVALLAYPDRHLQGLCGDAWLQFLDQSLGDKRFSQGCGCVFGSVVYQPRVTLDADQVLQLCEHWLHAMTPRLQQRSRAQ